MLLGEDSLVFSTLASLSFSEVAVSEIADGRGGL